MYLWPIRTIPKSSRFTQMPPANNYGQLLLRITGNRPIVFFSQKLSNIKHKYSVTKIELLAIVETLKKFKDMLWGQNIKCSLIK
jgi:hypothetical protein